MRQLMIFWHARPMVILLGILVFAMTIATAYAAYQTTRPITEGTYGYIYQDNLYGEGAVHKGADFPATLDTDVIAIANGTVRDVNEAGLDNCRVGEPNCSYFGNYILVRHDQQHYDRTTNQMAYVYSLYAHLSRDGAFVNVGDNVVAGQIIGDVDNTGNSDGNHLHLQIMIDPDPNRTVDLSWTEVDSRNPELWVRPYNGNTGTVVGKVTSTGGTPYPDVTIYGARSGHNPDGLAKDPAWDYRTSLTYNNAALNPDDILLENWGTTDVTPGRYHITTSAGGDLGWHDVVAGRVTYVGLFPVWLPYVLGNYNGWNSAIVVRNNSDTYQAQVNTTYFNQDGTVRYQTQTYIPPRASATLTPPSGFAGSALVVSSEDIGVVVENRKSGWYAYAYTGQSVPNTIGYLPQILQYLGTTWHTNIQAMNTGVQPTNITTNFYKQDGTPAPNGTTTLANVAVNGSGDVTQDMSNGDTLYVGRMSAAQPVAGVVRVSDNSNYRRLGYSSIPVADTTVWLPFVMTRLNNQWGAAIWVQNTTGTGSTVSLDFYQNGT